MTIPQIVQQIKQQADPYIHHIAWRGRAKRSVTMDCMALTFDLCRPESRWMTGGIISGTANIPQIVYHMLEKLDGDYPVAYCDNDAANDWQYGSVTDCIAWCKKELQL